MSDHDLWELTWVENGDVLCHPERVDDPDELCDGGPSSGRTSCGVELENLSIPGIFTRMGASRCEQCCDVLGWPPGVGSPKNDDRIRELLGLHNPERT